MKCTLMNKFTEVLEAEYNEKLKVFTNIYKIKNIEYAPLIIFNSYKKENDITLMLTKWFKGRGIPSWRDDLELLLAKLNITSEEELLDKAFGLSLSDQYWLKESNTNILYKDINFFEHEFKYSEFTNAIFENTIDSSTKISLITPNNTTDGRLKKAWIIENNKRYLLKSAHKNEIMQPFNEVLASMICERLNFNHVTYTIDIINNHIVSKCVDFIDPNTEFIPAYQVLSILDKKENAYQEYINILTKEGIEKAREKLENMFILDYLILNEDRHLNNFGIIRDVNTLKWLDIAPIFDNGEALKLIDYNDEELVINGEGRFFYSIVNFDTIISKIIDLKRINIENLDGIVEEFANLLYKYQPITKITDKRIDKTCTLLMSRIIKLKEKISQ